MNFQDTLRELFSLHSQYQSDFQLDHWVTARVGITRWGKFKQALQELYQRHVSLYEQYLDMREREVKLARVEEQLATMHEGHRRELLDIKAERMGFRIQVLRKSMRDQEREYRRFLAQAIALRPEKTDPESLRQAERDHWTTVLKAQLAVDQLGMGRVLPRTLELLPGLPEDVRSEIEQAIEKPLENVTWYRSLSTAGSEYDYSLACVPLNLDVRQLVEENPTNPEDVLDALAPAGG